MTFRNGLLTRYLILLLAFLPAVSIGCGASRWRLQPQWPSFVHRSAKIPVDASKEEILAYVNQASEPIHSWRTTSGRVSVTGVPVPLKAMVAIEEPNHLRMTISGSLSGQSEVDLGSSDQSLWFWMRQMEPQAIMTVNHCDLEAVQSQLPVPVQPEWMMEVLGVKPIDGKDAELIRDPDNPYRVKLVSHHTNDMGMATRRMTTIDLRKGEIVYQELDDSQHRLIATAELSHYQDFPQTTARLPSQITFHWVQQDAKMQLSLNGVEINPPQLPREIWEAPAYANCPVRRLTRDELLPMTAGVENRKVREKPRAITEYQLDQETGEWSENRFVKLPGAQQPPTNSSTIQPVSGAIPEQIASLPAQTIPGPQDAAPFPDFGSQPAAQNSSSPVSLQKQTDYPEWAQPAGKAELKSRDDLIQQ